MTHSDPGGGLAVLFLLAAAWLWWNRYAVAARLFAVLLVLAVVGAVTGR